MSTFSDFWREHRQKTGASGASEMQRHFYQWLYLRGTINLAERNTVFDNIEREQHRSMNPEEP